MKYGAIILVTLSSALAACASKVMPAKTENAVFESECNMNVTNSETSSAKNRDATPVRLAAIGPRYEPLIYGKEKPLVCSRPFPATGRMADNPNIQVMWENYLYPRPEGIWGEIGGNVERNGTLPFGQGRWVNACTVRLSHMFNKAGHKIPTMKGKTVSGGNGDQYIFRLTDMEAYIIDTFGKPDIDIDDGTGNSWDLPNKPGIVMLDLPDSGYTGHITIWNGAGTVDGANIGGYRVAFWEMPCFIPPERTVKQLSDNTK